MYEAAVESGMVTPNPEKRRDDETGQPAEVAAND